MLSTLITVRKINSPANQLQNIMQEICGSLQIVFYWLYHIWDTSCEINVSKKVIF